MNQLLSQESSRCRHVIFCFPKMRRLHEIAYFPNILHDSKFQDSALNGASAVSTLLQLPVSSMLIFFKAGVLKLPIRRGL
jgi:hypothetical protein